MKKIIKISMGIVVLGIFFYIGIAQAQDTEEIIKKVESTYKEISSFQADFSIEQEGKLGGEGKIWNEKNRFRMEVEMIAPVPGEKEKAEEKLTKQKQIIIFDGKVFWVHSNVNNQSQVMMLDSSKLNELPDAAKQQGENLMEQLKETPLNLLSPNSFIKYEEVQVSEEEWEGEDFYVLKEEQTEAWVKKENYLMYRIITYNKESSIISCIEFTEIKINEDIPDELFTFEVPEGIELIDIMDMLEAVYK